MFGENKSKIIENLAKMAKNGATRDQILSRAKLVVPEKKAEVYLQEAIKIL
jgi:hypothetical protein